jgi:hypothetical protein
MFASIRRYRMHKGSMEELARRVDEGFAEEICAQPGFVSYEFVDCGDGEVMTISISAGSRDLAQRTDENLLPRGGRSFQDLEFTRMGALDGEILVSRANEDILEPGHVGAARKFASVRQYALRDGSVAALMHKVDEIFADRSERLDGFEAYHALDCGRSEILSISLFRDQASAEASDDLALQFVGEELGEFDIERTEVIGGEVIVSRAMAELLEPAHA